MFFFLMTAVLVTIGCDAQVSEETCDRGDLNTCVDMIPHTQVGLPRTMEELDAICGAYRTGMTCMAAWSKRCIPTDSQIFLQKQTIGAQLLMHFLCNNETSLRRDFSMEPTCWAVVSAEWSSCIHELQYEVRDIIERPPSNAHFNKNTELCCARDALMSCVAIAAKVCSAQAGNLLLLMTWVLAQDIAACGPRAYCTASWPQFSTPMLTALSGVLLYSPRNYV